MFTRLVSMLAAATAAAAAMLPVRATAQDIGLLRFKKGAAGGAFIREGSGEVIINGLADMYRLGG